MFFNPLNFPYQGGVLVVDGVAKDVADQFLDGKKWNLSGKRQGIGMECGLRRIDLTQGGCTVLWSSTKGSITMLSEEPKVRLVK